MGGGRGGGLGLGEHPAHGGVGVAEVGHRAGADHLRRGGASSRRGVRGRFGGNEDGGCTVGVLAGAASEVAPHQVEGGLGVEDGRALSGLVPGGSRLLRPVIEALLPHQVARLTLRVRAAERAGRACARAAGRGAIGLGARTPGARRRQPGRVSGPAASPPLSAPRRLPRPKLAGASGAAKGRSGATEGWRGS
jgi:hypothetical protein